MWLKVSGAIMVFTKQKTFIAANPAVGRKAQIAPAPTTALRKFRRATPDSLPVLVTTAE
jgi:hypothetical protein